MPPMIVQDSTSANRPSSSAAIPKPLRGRLSGAPYSGGEYWPPSRGSPDVLIPLTSLRRRPAPVMVAPMIQARTTSAWRPATVTE